MLKLTLLVSVLFFSGCLQKPDPEPKIIYIKNNYPRQKTLKGVKTYEINDIVVIDGRLCLKRKDLRKASKTSSLLRKQNYFYRKQAFQYNKKFLSKSIPKN